MDVSIRYWMLECVWRGSQLTLSQAQDVEYARKHTFGQEAWRSSVSTTALFRSYQESGGKLEMQAFLKAFYKEWPEARSNYRRKSKSYFDSELGVTMQCAQRYAVFRPIAYYEAHLSKGT